MVSALLTLVATVAPVIAEIAVPSVGAEPLAPSIMSVSAAVPVPIVKLQVDAEPADVTFGILEVVGVTVLVNVAEEPSTFLPEPLLRDTVLLYASVPRLDRSPKAIHLVPSKINSELP